MFVFHVFVSQSFSMQTESDASSPTGIAGSLSERTTLVVSAAHAFTCFDAKNDSDSTAMRQSTFECMEHEAVAIQNWLIPHIMCCNRLRCVPSFAEHQQTFPIEKVECNEKNDRCHMILHCRDALDALKRITVGTVIAVVIVILSTLWMDNRTPQIRRQQIIISRKFFYEQASKIE